MLQREQGDELTFSYAMSQGISIDLKANAKAADSDEVLRSKAVDQVDTVLRMIGRLTAERLWDQFAPALPDLGASKTAFMNEAGEHMVESTSVEHRANVENSIFQQLRMQRAERIEQN